MILNGTAEEEFRYKIYVSAEVILIKHSDYEKIILLELSGSNLCFEIDPDIMTNLVFIDMRQAHSILGVLKVDQFHILLYVSEAECIGKVKDSKIFKIKEVGFIPICNEVLFANTTQEIKNYILGVRTLLAHGYYYSFDYDLTNIYYRQDSKNFLGNANIDYFWNHSISKIFMDNQINSIFICILICGYVGISNQIDLYGANINLYLISRRNTNMPGTRHNCKGIDDFGNAANFVETEQILKSENRIFSFVIYRGYPFVFYRKKKFESGLKLIDKSKEIVESSILKHIDIITSKEKQNIFILNLLSENSSSEHELNQHINPELFPVSTSNEGLVQYLTFECKADIENGDYKNIETFINNLLENDHFMNTIQYYLEDKGKYCMMQKGVFRVNCNYSLDRTNLLQTAICWKLIEHQFMFLGFDTISLFGQTYLDTKNRSLHPVLSVFKNLWAVNGDEISMQYACYESDIKDKKGKKSLLGRFQSISNIFVDYYAAENFKNECIYLLVQKACNILTIEDEQELIIEKLKDKYTKYQDLFVSVHSWNVAGSKKFKGEKIDLIDWLYPIKDLKNLKDIKEKDINPPDIYLIGFQEIVDLSATNIMFNSNSSNVELWYDILITNLNKIDNYKLLKIVDLVGIALYVFVKEKLFTKIQYLECHVVKTGMMGAAGNKGSVFVRFSYYDTQFAISCGHLSAGGKHNKARISELTFMINKYLRNPATKEELKVKEHDIFIVFGDVNFRLEMEYETAVEYLKKGESISKLQEYDQFTKEKAINTNLLLLEEGPLNFLPTYKYEIGSCNYTTKKKRTPSWCDRIFFNKSEHMKLIKYNSVPSFRNSDHKPIYGLFKVTASQVLNDEKEKIKKEIKDKKMSLTSLTSFINTNVEQNTTKLRISDSPIKKTMSRKEDDEKKISAKILVSRARAGTRPDSDKIYENQMNEVLESLKNKDRSVNLKRIEINSNSQYNKTNIQVNNQVSNDKTNNETYIEMKNKIEKTDVETISNNQTNTENPSNEVNNQANTSSKIKEETNNNPTINQETIKKDILTNKENTSIDNNISPQNYNSNLKTYENDSSSSSEKYDDKIDDKDNDKTDENKNEIWNLLDDDDDI